MSYLVLAWLETVLERLSQTMATSGTITKMFQRLGMDIRVDDGLAGLKEHLSQFQENSIYSSLLENQAALDCEN